MKNKYHKIISITDEHLTFFQAKETGAPTFRQTDIRGLKDEGIIKKLIVFFKELKINPSGMVMVIHRQNALMRFMTLPSLQIQELRNMAALQIAGIVPYAEEEVVFDLKVLSVDGTGNSKVMIIIVPRESIERYWKIYVKTDAMPSCITLSSFGVWLWHCRHCSERTAVFMIIDMNEHDGEICICTGENLYASRALRLPEGDIAADNFKFLLKEIDLTVDGYVQERLGPLPVKIMLTGARGIPEDLSAILIKEYELPVEAVDHGGSKKGTLGSATALLGFSSADLTQSVNLIPQDLVQTHLRTQAKRAIIRMMGAILILVLLVIGVGALYVYRKNKYVEDLNAKWAETKKQLDVMEDYKAKIDAMTGALNNRVIFKDMFAVVTRSAGPNISLFNINISDDRVLSMQGVAKNQADINSFQEGLMRSSFFANVRLDFVNKRTTQDSEASYFKISCKMK